jgi:hypothetical protein
MNLTKKLVSLAAAAALVAGASAMATTPATAAAKPKIKGSTTLSFPPAILDALAANQITFDAVDGGKVDVDGSTGFANVTFPVTGPVEDGKIKHKGTLEIKSGLTDVTLSIKNPVVAYATDGSGTGSIGGVVNGLPSWTEPFASVINGTFRDPLFNLSDVKVTVKSGKAKKAGKAFTRTDTVKITGNLSYNSSQDSANLFNAALTKFPVGPAIFTPNMDLGVFQGTSQITVSCKTLKACK